MQLTNKLLFVVLGLLIILIILNLFPLNNPNKYEIVAVVPVDNAIGIIKLDKQTGKAWRHLAFDNDESWIELK
jgi:hypothetical protein